MAGNVRMLAWRRADEGQGHSLARVERTDSGWRCDATEVLVMPDDLFTCWFTVELDPAWHTRAVRVSVLSEEGERSVELAADASGGWQLDGRPAAELNGCIDVDVAATPLTNTFPINRLSSLPVGDAMTSAVAWVDVPSLQVSRVEQTYRRLGANLWEYSDRTYGAFELTVDDDGFVLDYEGLAMRVR